RMVFCGEATVLDVALCIVKGLVVQSLISCVATAVFGEAAAFMLKLVGIGQDTYGLIEAIKSKDPKEIVIATVRLAVSVFTLKSQCFAGDTLVSTEEGNRRIDEIKPGDKVLSYNTETGENELQEVKNVSVSKTDILVHIITDDGRDIETTMFHPFYVKNVKNEDGTGEWKAASNLKAGDELLSEDGNKVKVSEVKVEKLAEEITVYNLELDEVHTYYVAGGVLVHNMCATDNNSDTSDSEGGKNTKHGEQRLAERGFSQEKVDDIVNNYSQKVYQDGGRTVYAKKNGNYYDVIIKNSKGEIVTAVGGNTKSLKTWKNVIRMLNNNGGYSSLPMN
ncbi:Hint domain-containing protein, partial [Bovifimicola ammoniilytica]|uniref:Hint domain-containing protein n=1 Tax=Bovifimicola ammoniilytica TaxID=2981720 RepID=UPI0021D2845C